MTGARGFVRRVGAVAGGRGRGRLSRGGRRAGALADQRRARRDVGRIEQPRDRHRHERRVGDPAVAVGVHEPARFGEQEPRLRILRPARGDVGEFEDREHLQQRDAARGRRRHAHLVDAVRAAQRLGLARTVGGQVRGRERAGPRLGAGARDDRLGDRRFEQGARPARGDVAQRSGVGGVAQRLARLHGAAVGLAEQRPGIRQRRLGKAAAGEAGEPPGHWEAVLGRACHVLEQLRPREAPVLLVGEPEHGDRTRHAGGPAAGDGLRVGQGLTLGVEEHAGRGARRRRLAPVVGGDAAGLRVVVQQEGAPADARTLWLDQTEGSLHRDRRVHGAAATTQHREPGLYGDRVRGGHAGRARRAGRRRAGSGLTGGRRVPAGAGGEQAEQEGGRANGRRHVRYRHEEGRPQSLAHPRPPSSGRPAVSGVYRARLLAP